MSHNLDDYPVREILELGRRWSARMDGKAHRAVEDHEERMHLPVRDMSPLTAIPFAGEQIPDPDLARIVELVSEGESLSSAAAALGHPLVLVERELARYYARHRRFCQEWALP
jgi:hypothetical protein